MNKTSSLSRFSPESGGKVSSFARAVGSYSLLALAINTACAPISVAGAATWNGDVSGDWFEGGNWSTGNAPGTNETVYIHQGEVLLTDGSAEVGDVNIAHAKGDVSSLTVSGLDSTLTAGQLMIGKNGGNGELTITDGGTVKSGTSTVGLRDPQ